MAVVSGCSTHVDLTQVVDAAVIYIGGSLIPDDNPFTPEKALLGRYLFYDDRLSGNKHQSCASCHQRELAFSDGLPFSVGSTGEAGLRSAPSLTNVANRNPLTWANPLLDTLESQALVPMFGDQPIELGVHGNGEEALAALRSDARYQELFTQAFPDAEDPFTLGHITRALASFERMLISDNSPYDRYLRGETSALSEAENHGRRLFFSERLGCGGCHHGADLSDAVANVVNDDLDHDSAPFHNTGLYNLDENGGYPDSVGLITFTGDPADMGRFRTPSLRNIAVTAPYMHDGSIPSLNAVLDHYAAGGRTITSGPHAGVGANNPYKSPRITGFSLTKQQRTYLIAFLTALTDEDFLNNAALSNPWTVDASR